jgi:hypothetical protein
MNHIALIPVSPMDDVETSRCWALALTYRLAEALETASREQLLDARLQISGALADLERQAEHGRPTGRLLLDRSFLVTAEAGKVPTGAAAVGAGRAQVRGGALYSPAATGEG